MQVSNKTTNLFQLIVNEFRTDIGFSRGQHFWTITAVKCAEQIRGTPGIALGVMHYSELDLGIKWTKNRIGYYLVEGETGKMLIWKVHYNRIQKDFDCEVPLFGEWELWRFIWECSLDIKYFR